MYKLSIRKVVDNPNYDAEKARWSTVYDRPSEPAILEVKSLEVDLTDEEFAAIKKAVLEVM